MHSFSGPGRTFPDHPLPAASPVFGPVPPNRSPRPAGRARRWSPLSLLVLLLAGCGHLHPHPLTQYVYVTAKDAVLRDRIAAVSNRTGTVKNGEKLEVLDHSRRFLKVKTPSGAVGWIEEKLTADQAVADQFDALREKSQADPIVAGGVTRDDVYMHLTPGRETTHFFRLGENEQLLLLKRASVPKPETPGAAVAARPLAPLGEAAPATPTGPVMEDWWLARDSHGDTGWVFARMVDVSAPDALQRYSEGQRIVAAYLLNRVDDLDSGMLDNGQPVTSIPEYVTVMAPFRSGLPYDFDQVRVFIWNPKKHRYETGFREKNIEGYLPVVLSMQKDPYDKSVMGSTPLPSFTYRVLAADAPVPVPNPETGLFQPGKTIAKTYRLEGNICRRILAPGVPPPEEAHPEPPPEKKAKAARRHR